jgi:chromosome segregation ATPase
VTLPELLAAVAAVGGSTTAVFKYATARAVQRTKGEIAAADTTAKLRALDAGAEEREAKRLWQRLTALERRLDEERDECDQKLAAMGARLDEAEARCDEAERRADAAEAKARLAEGQSAALARDLDALRREIGR